MVKGFSDKEVNNDSQIKDLKEEKKKKTLFSFNNNMCNGSFFVLKFKISSFYVLFFNHSHF